MCLVTQLCQTLCDPIDCSPPGSSWNSPPWEFSSMGILQARILEWVAVPFSRQEYWSGLPCPPPGDLPNPGIKPRFPALQADSLPSEPPGKPREIP